jgi:DUF4097 and DUF4098 domain-containing protein YvlB
MKINNSLKGSVIACVVILLILAGCVEQFREFEQQQEVIKPYTEEHLEILENAIETEKISIDFTTKNGYIEIHLWEKDTYRIEVNKWAKGETAEKAKAAAEELQVTLSEQTKAQTTMIRLNVAFIKDTGADITAYLPRKSFDIVELSSLNGYLEMEEITASYVTLETTNGSIKAYLTADNIRVETINGGIKGSYQGDDINLTTVNGDITIQAGAAGVFDVSTVNGDIDMTVGSDFDFDLETTYGKISVTADDVVYTLDDRIHKKGSAGEDTKMFITASTVNGSLAVTKVT